MDLIQPGPHNYIVATGDDEAAVTAAAIAAKVGAIARMKTSTFEFEANILAINGEWFEGLITKCPVDYLVGKVRTLPLSHIWGRYATSA